MSKEPLVSVIMPFYNGHNHIAESVGSVMNQTYSNFELIIVNDGSQMPNPETILAHLDTSKIRFINHDHNKGLAAARNTGFSNARGELILPLDCDDLITPNFLAETVKAILNNANIDAVYTQVHIFGDVNLDWTPQPTMLNIMSGIPIPSTILYWRRVFDLVNGYNESIKYVPDCDFWLRVLSKGGRLFTVDKPLYHYRKHTDSLSDVGQLTEVRVLADANRQLYADNFIDVLAMQEKKYWELKADYVKLDAGFRRFEAGYQDLLGRYDDVVEKLQKRSIRYHLRKLMPFLSAGKA